MRESDWSSDVCSSDLFPSHDMPSNGSSLKDLKCTHSNHGASHKRWSMWFNSKQRAEPYQPLTWELWSREIVTFTSGGFHTGAAWLSSARVVRCWVSPATSATLIFSCHHLVGHSEETAGDKPEEGGDDVKSSWPLRAGLHTCYNGGDNGTRTREGKLISKNRLSSDCTLQLECMKSESLVIVDQLCYGEYVSPPLS